MIRYFTRKRWNMVWIAVICIALLSLAACGSSGTSGDSGQGNVSANPSDSNSGSKGDEEKDKLVPLNVGMLKIGALTNLYAAKKLGYFEKEGLDVTFTQMGGGAELLPAVSAGKIDITLSIPSPAIQAREKGFDFLMVMQNEVSAKQGRDSMGFFVRKDSGIESFKDMKGKTIAVNNIGNQTWLSVVEMLDRNGVDPKDVNFTELPFPNMQDALNQKQVDGVFDVEPFTTKMTLDPNLKVLSYSATEALPGQTLGAFFGSEKWLKAHRQIAEKFVDAMHETTEYLKAHPDETLKLTSEFTGIDADFIKKMSPILWDMHVDKDTTQKLLDLMQKHGLLKEKMNVDSILFPTALKY